MGKPFFAASLILLLCFAPVFGQTTTGFILGDITDTSGARLPGAAVRALNTQTGATRETLTNELGAYRFNALPPGTYTVSVEFPGFKAVSRQNVVLQLGQELKLDFAMEVGTVNENVTVTEQAPLVQTTENAVATVVDNQRIEELPLKTRNFMDLTLLSPGVVIDQAGAAVNTTDAISFYGVPERYKSIWLEGVDFNDEVTAGGTTQSSSTRTALGPDAIQEFQVMGNSYSTEYGRSGSGVVNVIIKTGGNDFHGNAFFFRRSDSIAKWNYFQHAPVPFESKQYGGTFGGPIKRDRAHFFLSYERRPLTQDIAVTIPQTLLDYVKSLNRGYDTNTDVTNTRTEANTVSKFTFALNPKHTLNVTWLYDSRRYLNENFGGKTTRDQGYDDGRSSYFGVATLTSLLGSNTVNEFRSNRSIQRLLRSIPNGTLFLPALVFPSGTFGTGTGNPQARIQKNWIFSDTLTYQFRQHNIKAGGEFNLVNATADANVTFNGEFDFLADKPVNPNDPTTLPYLFTQGINLRSTDPQFAHLLRGVNMYAAFFNDTWRITKNVTFNYGIRYDVRVWKDDLKGNSEFPTDVSEGQFWVNLITGAYHGKLFEVVPVDKKDWSPRIGLSWDPDGTGKSVLRAGYGFYYDRLNTSSLRDIAFAQPGIFTSQIGNDSRITGTSNSFYPNLPPPGSLPASGATSYVIPSRTATTPYFEQITAGYQRQLGSSYSFSADYVHLHGIHTERSRNVNAKLPDGTFPLLASGTQLILKDTGDTMKIHMISTRLEKRMSRRLAFLFGYSWARAYEFAETPSNDYNLNADWGPLPNDVRHRITSNALYELPWAFHVNGTVSFNTAPPYNITTGVTNAVLRTNSNPPGQGYNSGRGDSYLKVDLRTTKRIRLGERMNADVGMEMYNLFNTVNFNTYTGNLRSSTFGQPAKAFDPFQAQIALKFTF